METVILFHLGGFQRFFAAQGFRERLAKLTQIYVFKYLEGTVLLPTGCIFQFVLPAGNSSAQNPYQTTS